MRSVGTDGAKVDQEDPVEEVLRKTGKKYKQCLDLVKERDGI